MYYYYYYYYYMFSSVYSVFIVPTGTLRLPWLRFFRAFSSIVRQMPGYNSQRRGTARTLPKLVVLFHVLFVCKCVLYCCHWVSIQFHLTNMFVHIVGRYSDSVRAGRSGDRISVGARFSAPVQTGPGAYPASYTVGTGSFPGGKEAGTWRWPPTPYIAEDKERVELSPPMGLRGLL